ncbi:hypothetical protein CEP88_10005 [Roseobacter denitrificans]|nr:hypothetical protein CEP88_10005 [Roseobacter denitrificans]SFG03775.1 hypothetical protein SAMN05443635_10674 [Roseobacter denitrificans OCh 114]
MTSHKWLPPMEPCAVAGKTVHRKAHRQFADIGRDIQLLRLQPVFLSFEQTQNQGAIQEGAAEKAAPATVVQA